MIIVHGTPHPITRMGTVALNYRTPQFYNKTLNKQLCCIHSLSFNKGVNMKWYQQSFNKARDRKSGMYRPNRKYSRYDSRCADKDISYCSKCKHCWEISWQSSAPRVMMYQDFVTYGKPKKICPKCQGITKLSGRRIKKWSH